MPIKTVVQDEWSLMTEAAQGSTVVNVSVGGGPATATLLEDKSTR